MTSRGSIEFECLPIGLEIEAPNRASIDAEHGMQVGQAHSCGPHRHGMLIQIEVAEVSDVQCRGQEVPSHDGPTFRDG